MSRNFPLASDPRKVIAHSLVPAKDNPQSPEKVNARDQRVRDEAKQGVALKARRCTDVAASRSSWLLGA